MTFVINLNPSQSLGSYFNQELQRTSSPKPKYNLLNEYIGINQCIQYDYDPVWC